MTATEFVEVDGLRLRVSIEGKGSGRAYREAARILGGLARGLQMRHSVDSTWASKQ